MQESANTGKEVIPIKSIDALVDLLNHSYKFSQGDSGLQFSILTAISDLINAASFEFRIEEIRENLERKLFDQSGTLNQVKTGHEDPARSVIIEERSMIASRIETLLGEAAAEQSSPGEILEGMINRDMKFLSRDAGRSGRPDPYFSYVIYYLVKENTTGNDIFDRLFSEIKSHLLREDNLQNQLKLLLKLYNTKNPDTQITDEEFQKFINPTKNHPF